MQTKGLKIFIFWLTFSGELMRYWWNFKTVTLATLFLPVFKSPEIYLILWTPVTFRTRIKYLSDFSWCYLAGPFQNKYCVFLATSQGKWIPWNYEKENLVSLVLDGKRSLSITNYCFCWCFNKNFSKKLSFEDMRSIEYKRELLTTE